MIAHDIIAGLLKKYRFSPSELDEFLSQQTPRVLPEALQQQSQSTTGDQIGLAIGLGAVVIGPAIIGPLLLWDQLGLIAVVIALAALILGVVAIVVVVEKLRNQPSLLKDGLVVSGRIDEVSPRSGYEGEPCWDVLLCFEVEGSPVHVTRTVPDDHGRLAALIHEHEREIRILYMPSTPKQAMWAAELLYPCPTAPEPSAAESE